MVTGSSRSLLSFKSFKTTKQAEATLRILENKFDKATSQYCIPVSKMKLPWAKVQVLIGAILGRKSLTTFKVDYPIEYARQRVADMSFLGLPVWDGGWVDIAPRESKEGVFKIVQRPDRELHLKVGAYILKKLGLAEDGQSIAQVKASLRKDPLMWIKVDSALASLTLAKERELLVYLAKQSSSIQPFPSSNGSQISMETAAETALRGLFPRSLFGQTVYVSILTGQTNSGNPTYKARYDIPYLRHSRFVGCLFYEHIVREATNLTELLQNFRKRYFVAKAKNLTPAKIFEVVYREILILDNDPRFQDTSLQRLSSFQKPLYLTINQEKYDDRWYVKVNENPQLHSCNYPLFADISVYLELFPKIGLERLQAVLAINEQT